MFQQLFLKLLLIEPGNCIGRNNKRGFVKHFLFKNTNCLYFIIAIVIKF